MCKFGGLLVGWDAAARRALFTQARCEQWSCPECAEWMKSTWKLRGEMGARAIERAGGKADFVTITSHEALKTFPATLAVWRDAWPVLYSALKRRQKDLMFMAIPEKHKDKRMHVHLIWNAGVTERWLKDNGRSRGLGNQAKIKHMTDPHQAAYYVSKYLSKELGDDVPERFHRVRVSQNWPKIPTPVSEHSKLKWEFTRSEDVMWVWLAQCQRDRIAALDAKTGEGFDAGNIDFSIIY